MQNMLSSQDCCSAEALDIHPSIFWLNLQKEIVFHLTIPEMVHSSLLIAEHCSSFYFCRWFSLPVSYCTQACYFPSYGVCSSPLKSSFTWGIFMPYFLAIFCDCLHSFSTVHRCPLFPLTVSYSGYPCPTPTGFCLSQLSNHNPLVPDLSAILNYLPSFQISCYY